MNYSVNLLRIRVWGIEAIFCEFNQLCFLVELDAVLRRLAITGVVNHEMADA